MSGFEIVRCDRTLYPAFLETLGEAFGHSPGLDWFSRNVGACVPEASVASDEIIGRHYVAVERESGEVVGGVGAYPADIVVSEDMPGGASYIMRAVGIGQVCCHRKHRGSGVMRAALTAALDGAVKEGAVVGFLVGDRYRYGRFGFDYAGAETRLGFDFSRLCGVVDASGLTQKTAGVEDISEIGALYDTLPSRATRDERRWRTHIERRQFEWRVGYIDGRAACLAFAEPCTTICEVFGDAKTALAMVWSHMERLGLSRADVLIPHTTGFCDAVGAALLKASSGVSVTPPFLAAVLNPEAVRETLGYPKSASGRSTSPLSSPLFSPLPFDGSLSAPQPLANSSLDGSPFAPPPHSNSDAGAELFAVDANAVRAQKPLVFWISAVDMT